MKNSKRFIIRQLPLILAFVLLSLTKVNAMIYTLNLVLSGSEEVPANISPGAGTLTGTYDDVLNTLSFTLTFNGMLGATTAAHFHGPAGPGSNAPVQIAFVGFPSGVVAGTYSHTFILTDEQESQLLYGNWYVNIHTTEYPGGEIRSQLINEPNACNIVPLRVNLSGFNEVPPITSLATGTLTGTYDLGSKLLSINLSFSDMLGTTTAAHIHGPATPGVVGPVLIPLTGFPLGVTSGSYSNSFILTPEEESYLLGGTLYVNIHTNIAPGGEIRGQLSTGTLYANCENTTVPVSNWALLFGGLLILAYTVFILRKRS